VILLDTTVLVYAVGGSHALAGPARGLVHAIERGKVRGTTTAEVVQEFAHVRARRRGRADAVALGRAFATLLSPLLSPGADDLDAGLELFEQTPLGAFDAVLAASAISRGSTLVSADSAFASVPGLEAAPLDGSWVAAVVE
jgi:predicted nucleic acid-binding protein